MLEHLLLSVIFRQLTLKYLLD